MRGLVDIWASQRMIDRKYNKSSTRNSPSATLCIAFKVDTACMAETVTKQKCNTRRGEQLCEKGIFLFSPQRFKKTVQTGTDRKIKDARDDWREHRLNMNQILKEQVEGFEDTYFSFSSLTLAPTEFSWSSSLFFLLSVFLRFLNVQKKQHRTCLGIYLPQRVKHWLRK